MKLTERDKILLKWLILIALFYSVWVFVLSPLNRIIDTRSAQLSELNLQKTITEATLPLYDSTLLKEKEVNTAIEKQFGQFFDVSSTAKLESYLIPLLNQFNVHYEFFEAVKTIVTAPTTTLSLSDASSYKIKELVDDYNQVVNTAKVLPTTQSTLLKSQVSYTLMMSFNDYIRLTDAIDQLNNSILISKSSYNIIDNTAQLSFDIYSLEKLDFIN